MAAKTPAQKREQEKQTVGLMIELYCHGHHGTRGHALCPDCEALRSYADARVDHCPHMETKTFCSHALERPADDFPPPRPGDTAFDRDKKTEKVICPCK